MKLVLRRVAKVVVCVVFAVLLNGCYLLVDKRIRESAAIDYAVVRTTVMEIDEGTLGSDAAVEVLRRLEESMRQRVAYFEGEEPVAPESGADEEPTVER